MDFRFFLSRTPFPLLKTKKYQTGRNSADGTNSIRFISDEFLFRTVFLRNPRNLFMKIDL